jgi:ethanolamine ammonia-lyase small subunit
MTYTTTREMLDCQLAHARARDAVHYPLDSSSLARELGGGIVVKSAAQDRAEYLRRPDLGRRLSVESRAQLEARKGEYDVAYVVADGLSPLAVHRHAPGLLSAVQETTDPPVTIVEQGRVAIGDEIGSILGAALVVVLIGERPGLTSPDSLGVYLTWGPRPGRSDAERNCISNIRAEGLSTGAAAQLLRLLMAESRARRLSGVRLKPVQTFLS